SDRERDLRRLRALEAVVAERPAADPPGPDARVPAPAPAAVAAPDLAVVRLVPPTATDVDEDSFVFIVDGGAGSSRGAPAGGRSQGRTGGPDAAPALPVAVALADPQPSTFRQGIAALDAGEPARAIEILERFVKGAPRDPDADNAILAVGDAWLALERPGNALQAFERVVRDFPAGDVVPEALLRYGETCRILGREAAARAAFQRLVRDHPASIAATRAELHLAAR
ncbi:MAG TPA: tetratricopeptide repeat protein, partial [Vulgatibacter sp.]